MEKFYIITNDMKDANRKITVKIKKCIESYGKKCYLEEQPEEGNFSKIKIPKDIDCVLTVGGDGTFIQASRRLFGRELPMLGINMGTLGYLTEVEVQNVEEAVKQLVEGNYTIEERMMLYGSAAYRNVRDVALNDIVMTRSGSMKIVHFNLYVNGEKADRISVTVMTVGQDGTISQEAVKTTGSFTYSDSKLNAGDKIAVYDGDVVPQLDGSVISDDDVSFFEITSAKGNEYSYRGMAAEEILFVPDVLPVNVADDKDNNPDNDSITITKNKMSYGSDSLGAGLGLDEDTTVDTGDYLALYATGNDDIQYAVITNVSTNNADYVITYKNVTWDEVQAAMDVYQTDNVSGESILQNQDISGIEQSVEQQAVDSGFAQSVVDEVAQAVVRTNSYQELQEYLSDTMDANISIVPQDITYLPDKAQGNVVLYSSKKPEVKLEHVRANLSTDLKHFENVSGLRLALDIGVEISFSNMKVIVSATFEQEVKININVSGKAIWKVWGIFPYIDDYRVAVSLDLYDYTGINFNVNVRTAEEDDDD